MGVIVTRNFEPLTKNLRWEKNDWQRVGEFIRNRILIRTAKGVDGQNVPFRPYSAAYAKKRLDAGLNPSMVDLTVSSDMLDAIVVFATETGVTVTFRK